MNTEERRALKILLAEGYKIDESVFRHWCEGKKAYFHTADRSSLWNHLHKEDIVREWKMEYGQVRGYNSRDTSSKN